LGNEILKSTILQVVDNQINSDNPPETRETYDRLITLGHSSEEAKRLIGIVVTAEIFDVMKNQEMFNKKRFVEALKKLPETPK
jgi:hypothetical protein